MEKTLQDVRWIVEMSLFTLLTPLLRDYCMGVRHAEICALFCYCLIIVLKQIE